MNEDFEPPLIDDLLDAMGLNAPFVLDVYADFRANPETVSAAWRRFFEALARGETPPLPVESRGEGNGVGGSAPPSALPVEAGERDGELIPLRGSDALIARNMEESRSLPTATSYRNIPVKVLEENRRFLNDHMRAGVDRKVSFTPLIAWAILRALKKYPLVNGCFEEVKGEPHRRHRTRVNLGVAVDLERKDGTRNLLVPNIKGAQGMDFRQFLDAFSDLLERARSGRLLPDDFLDTTVTLTNPGTVGTSASVPRLMRGQAAILAVGAIAHSAEAEGMSPETLSRLGLSKQMTVSCTYDHRIVQGAVSGSFLGEVENLLKGGDEFYDEIYHEMGVPYLPIRWTPDTGPSGAGPGGGVEEVTRQARVLQLINAYRVRGHLIADLDPLGSKPNYHPELDLHTYGLTLWDLDRRFITGAQDPGSAWDAPEATLREILRTMRQAYGGKIGIEYMNIQDPEQKAWIREHVEPDAARRPFDAPLRKHILERLLEAETFELFLHSRFPGHKRFSLEGSETVIPVLDQLLEEAARLGVEEAVLGMAHRGRLTVLTQIVGVDPGRIFTEFQGTRDPYVTQGSGDVKYHLGATGTHRTAAGKPIRLSLAPNPSHLEAVDPVVEGITRAKQESVGAEEGRFRILPILIHGDAAFAGQGVVAETFNFSQLKGYRTGGTVHIIINNQIGFTTPVESARSSPYPTDVAKMSQAPIFHVNGDDPEAAIRIVRWALGFRQAFQKDVVVDIFSYRRHGHNEADEPSYTQPLLYTKIRDHDPVAALYLQRLVAEGVLTAEEGKKMREQARQRLDDAFDRAQKDQEPWHPAPLAPARPRGGGAAAPRSTAVPRELLARITEGLTHVPGDVDVHPKLAKWMRARTGIMESGEGVDWAFAEALAFGSLVLEGVPVRLSGQDSVRGTFSQRHLLLHDDDTDVSWMALQHLDPDQAPFVAVDSPLSEEAVVGFEYGYSVGDPATLVMWEAQFGDFINEAQVMIDQFLAGSVAKWGQPSGLVLLLPHGYEGQGPEHSSARLERFLQLAAEDNLGVVVPSTPAQYFHLLRRQMCEPLERPLVVMTPKSLLRHPRAVSSVASLAGGRFEPLLIDPAAGGEENATRLVLCSGKVYYDLAALREKAPGVTLCRVEELYPFPLAALRDLRARHPEAEVVWAQEEARNMGAWTFVNDRLRREEEHEIRPRYVGRPESASPATGYQEIHRREQERVVHEAMGVTA